MSNASNVIRIPLNGPFFLNGSDSYLRFTAELTGVPQVTSGDTTTKAKFAYLDSSAQSFVQRLRIEGPDGSELERIEDYNVLHSLLTDFQVDRDHQFNSKVYEKTAGRCGAIGFKNTDKPNDATVLATDAASATGGLDAIYQVYPYVNDEADVANAKASTQAAVPALTNFIEGADGSEATTKKVCGIKLCSGLLRNQRYLPLLALKGAGLTLEITLANSDNIFVTGNDGSSTYNITDVEYIASTIDFDEAFTNTFMQMIQANGMIQMHGVSYQNFVWTWSAGNTTEIIPIALRVRSLKSIIVGMRKQSFINNQHTFSIGRRVSNGLSSYVFNIGSIRLPQAPVQISQDAYQEGMTEAFAEMVKVFGSLTDLSQSGRVSIEQYYDAGFALGVDCEAYSQDSSLLESGLDTASQSLPVRLELNFESTLTNERATTGSVTGFSQGARQASRQGLSTAAAAITGYDTLRADIFGIIDVIYSVTAEVRRRQLLS